MTFINNSLKLQRQELMDLFFRDSPEYIIIKKPFFFLTNHTAFSLQWKHQ